MAPVLAKRRGGGSGRVDGFKSESLYSAEQHLFMETFKRLLVERGFGIVDREKLKQLQGGSSSICNDNETIFNRALGNDKKQSNFFVFMRKTPDKVEIYYSNPEIKSEDALKAEKREDYIISRIFVMGDETVQATKFADEVMEYSKKKPVNEYRKISHGHWGTVGKRWVKDDGVSRFQDVVRIMALYHIDYDATTPHNSYEEDIYDYLSKIEDALGMKKIIGLELTASFPPNGPNGPHLLLWIADRITARAIKREILDFREDMKMISYFSGMTIWEMLPILGKYRDAKKLALGIAHPINFHSRALEIYNVGLLSAVENRKINIANVEQIVAMSDSVAACNPGPENPKFDSQELKNYVTPIVRKHLGTDRLTTNNINFAFANEMVERYSTYTHFDPDDHTTLPMNYDCGGEKAAQGFTKIVVPQVIYDSLSEKPSPEQLIKLIRERRIVMKSVQFLVNNDNSYVIAPARKDVSWKKVKLAEELSKAARRRYIGALSRDFWHMLLRGEFNEILNMRG
ncbi:MAG: hypothetical protein QXT05_00560 [Candidatus Bilamarchaeaceae archaeon]